MIKPTLTGQEFAEISAYLYTGEQNVPWPRFKGGAFFNGCCPYFLLFSIVVPLIDDHDEISISL